MTYQEHEGLTLQWNIYKKKHTNEQVLRFQLAALLDDYIGLLCSREIVPLLSRYVQEAFICETYQIKGAWRRLFHYYRKNVNRSDQYDHKDWVDLANALFYKIGQSVFPSQITDTPEIPEIFKSLFKEVQIKSFQHQLAVVILELDEEKKLLYAYTSEGDQEKLTIRINPEEDHLLASFKLLKDKAIPLPVKANLIKVVQLEDDVLQPAVIVLEPDILMNVTTISETYGYRQSDALIAANQRFKRNSSNKALILGKAVNYLLDKLMENPEEPYANMIQGMFLTDALAFLNLTEDDLQFFKAQIPTHYQVLKQTILQYLPKVNIHRENCYLEPVFMSSWYGIQGRLDVFHIMEGAKKMLSIIELKSGKPPDEGSRLQQNHYIQTLLYDLLIRSTFGGNADIRNYILYSRSALSPLRFASHNWALQSDAINRRNEILALDYTLMQTDRPESADSDFISILSDNKRWETWPTFLVDAIDNLQQAYFSLESYEKEYFRTFLGFIAREQFYSRLGGAEIESRRGMASLWLSSDEEKEERYELLKKLEITNFDASDGRTLLRFKRTEDTHALAHFRASDIVLLYPNSETDDAALNNQLFKSTIVKISPTEVTVALRNSQYQAAFFWNFKHWNIEKDVSDSGFENMYQNLAEFIAMPKTKRKIWLGVLKPGFDPNENFTDPPGLSEYQLDVFRKAICAKDYFILWGPPGTGKTSLMLRAFIWHYAETVQKNVLVLAYTNRAVDEICASIESIDAAWKNKYIRMGSRHSTEDIYEHALLRNKLEAIWEEKGNIHLKHLASVVDNHRVFVSTVAGLGTHYELLRYKQFDTIIIDEASQIVEPMIINYLCAAEKVIMIGDHQQLPAVVTQSSAYRKVPYESLRDLGLSDPGDSLFERLYYRCMDMDWDHAYSVLSQQGRMHQKIMQFVNVHFYHNQLQLLPENLSYGKTQRQNGSIPNLEFDHPFWKGLSLNRTIFIDSSFSEEVQHLKTNRHEAALIADLLLAYEKHCSDSGLTACSIGIIAPYRAQIALIKDSLNACGVNPDPYSIDTVERYQGSARDIIIFATCVQHYRNLNEIGSINRTGTVDRKLNVALTRARAGIAIIGNRIALEQNAIYKNLIDSYEPIDAWLEPA